jgi:hypothetical protein
MPRNDSGQLHTLEGFAAAILMVLVLIFVVQATSITPLTASAANLHVEAQLQFYGRDILATLDDPFVEGPFNSTAGNLSPLKYELLRWDGKQYVWSGSRYVQASDANQSVNASPVFRLLERVFRPAGIAHNLEIFYIDNSSSNPSQKKWVWNGNPSLNAISVSRTLALHNNVTNISTFSEFYGNTSIGDIDTRTCPPGCLYNVVEVRLTLWRL